MCTGAGECASDQLASDPTKEVLMERILKQSLVVGSEQTSNFLSAVAILTQTRITLALNSFLLAMLLSRSVAARCLF